MYIQKFYTEEEMKLIKRLEFNRGFRKGYENAYKQKNPSEHCGCSEGTQKEINVK